MDFTLKRGDTTAKLAEKLMLDGKPLDLTGATVECHMHKRGKPYKHITAKAKITQEAAAPDPTVGDVEYHLTPDDASVVGSYDQEWEATLKDGKIVTVPQSGYNTVTILRDLTPPKKSVAPVGQSG